MVVGAMELLEIKMMMMMVLHLVGNGMMVIVEIIEGLFREPEVRQALQAVE